MVERLNSMLQFQIIDAIAVVVAVAISIGFAVDNFSIRINVAVITPLKIDHKKI
jgi:hypothetical protein